MHERVSSGETGEYFEFVLLLPATVFLIWVLLPSVFALPVNELCLLANPCVTSCFLHIFRVGFPSGIFMLFICIIFV